MIVLPECCVIEDCGCRSALFRIFTRYNEVKLYDFSASHKRNYDSEPVNEFTQLVYDGQTREVGVAYSSSRTNKQYVVARYYKKRNDRLLDMEVHPPHSGSCSCKLKNYYNTRLGPVVQRRITS